VFFVSLVVQASALMVLARAGASASCRPRRAASDNESVIANFCSSRVPRVLRVGRRRVSALL